MGKVLFQADLNFMPIHDVLQWIDMNRLSCVLNVSLEGDSGMIFYLDHGKIVFATSRKRGGRLGELLVRSGALDESQVFRALTECRGAGISFPRYLVEKAMISAHTLSEIFAQLVEKLLLEVFACRSGEVTVTTPLPESVLNGPIHLDTGRILFESIRILDEMNRDSRNRDEAIEAVNRRLYNEEFQLPVLPGVLMQLISLMEDEKTTFQDMARLIMTDQVLISRILKIANSPLYGGTGQVDSIHFAIVRLGMREIMNIVTGIQVNSMQYRDIPQEKLQHILDDALKTAFVASGLARHCRLDPEEAFLGGLLLDLGKTVILSVAGDFHIEQTLLDDLLTTRHADIGALIAKKWNYPENIQNLIRYHHNRHFGGLVNRMIALIQVADQAVQAGSEKGVDPELLRSIDLPVYALTDVYPKAMESFSQIKSL